MVKTGGRLQSRWRSDIQKLEDESSGYKPYWFNDMVWKEVRSGANSHFWYDPWLSGGPLLKRFPMLFSLSMEKTGSVKDIVEGRIGGVLWKGRWRREVFVWEHEQLLELIQVINGVGLKWEGGIGRYRRKIQLGPLHQKCL